MRLINKPFERTVTGLLIFAGLSVLSGCTNGDRTYKVTSVNYSKGLDTLFAKEKTDAFRKALQNKTIEVSIKDDTLMIVKGLPTAESLTLHRVKVRKNSDLPKYTYRISDKDGNTLDISLSGRGFKNFTLKTRALYLFPEKIGTDKLTLSSSDTRKWQAGIEIKGEKQ